MLDISKLKKTENIWQGLVDDFRTANWLEIVPYPELVYQKSQLFLQTG